MDKYQQSDYDALLSKQQGELSLNQKELKEAEDNLEFTRGLVKKGFVPLEQLRIQELAVETKRFKVSQGKAELGALEKFERERKITELEGKANEAENELQRVTDSQKAATEKAQSEADAAADTEKLEKQTLDRIKAADGPVRDQGPAGRDRRLLQAVLRRVDAASSRGRWCSSSSRSSLCRTWST